MSMPGQESERYAGNPPGRSMHEVAGEVLASRHPGIAAGDHVVGWATGMNGMAELTVTEGSSLIAYDSGTAATVAITIQPLACVIYAARQLTDVAGASVAVVGQGPIGVLFSHVLKSTGAAKVTGVDRIDRSDVASQFGVDECVHSASDRWANALADSERPQIVVEAVGHQVATIRDCITAVAPGGQLFYFGIPDDPVYPFPMWEFLRKNLTMISGLTLERTDCLRAARDYLDEYPKLASSYVTNVFSIDDIAEAFAVGIAPSPGRLKIVIDFVA